MWLLPVACLVSVITHKVTKYPLSRPTGQYTSHNAIKCSVYLNLDKGLNQKAKCLSGSKTSASYKMLKRCLHTPVFLCFRPPKSNYSFQQDVKKQILQLYVQNICMLCWRDINLSWARAVLYFWCNTNLNQKMEQWVSVVFWVVKINKRPDSFLLSSWPKFLIHMLAFCL